MVELTKKQGGRPVPLSDIAANRQISLSYLEQLFAGLRRHGLVKSHRGPGGGYLLGMPAGQITVGAIVRAAEDSPTARRSPNNNRRQKSTEEASDRLWDAMNSHIAHTLDGISLDDVVAERVEVYQKVFRTEA